MTLSIISIPRAVIADAHKWLSQGECDKASPCLSFLKGAIDSAGPQTEFLEINHNDLSAVITEIHYTRRAQGMDCPYIETVLRRYLTY